MRTDIHRPGLMEPADYTYVGYMYQGSSDIVFQAMTDNGRDPEYRAGVALLREKPFHGNHHEKLTCDHCGAVFAYGVVFQHKNTGEGICVGHICASGSFSFPNRISLLRAKAEKVMARIRKAERIGKKAVEWLQQHEDLKDVLAANYEDRPYKHHIINDIASKLWKYGSLSERQAAFVRSLVVQESARVEIEATRIPVPEGLQEVRGNIISIKPSGRANWNWLIQDDRGFRVYGPMTSDASGCERGDRIGFLAELKQSNQDKYFGFIGQPYGLRVYKSAKWPEFSGRLLDPELPLGSIEPEPEITQDVPDEIPF